MTTQNALILLYTQRKTSLSLKHFLRFEESRKKLRVPVFILVHNHHLQGCFASLLQCALFIGPFLYWRLGVTLYTHTTVLSSDQIYSRNIYLVTLRLFSCSFNNEMWQLWLISWIILHTIRWLLYCEFDCFSCSLLFFHWLMSSVRYAAVPAAVGLLFLYVCVLVINVTI